MKWILLLVSALLILVGVTAMLLFTAGGNRLLTPMIEAKVSDILGMPVQLQHFALKTDHFELFASLGSGNQVEVAGNYSLFSRNLYARYRVRLGKLEALTAVTKQPLRGAFLTEGNVTGTFDALRVQGHSDLAHSTTRYNATINDYTMAQAALSVKDARISELLYMGMQPAFADGSLSIDAEAAPLSADALQGALRIGVAGGRFDTKVMQNEFNVTLPQTDFTFQTDAKFTPKQADYTLALLSNLAQVRSNGTVSPASMAADLTYDVRFEELALLKPLTNAPLRGPFSTKGNVTGDQKLLKIAGSSDVAGSQTTYRTEVRDMKPGSVTATIRHAALDRLLYLAGEDALAYGSIDVDIDLKSLDPKALKGAVDAKLHDGKLNKTLIQKRFGTSLPTTDLGAVLHAVLTGDTVTYDADMDSSVGRIASKGELFPQRSGMDLTYSVDIKELALFKSLTQQPFRGPLTLNGTLKGDKKRLDAHLSSSIAGSQTRLDAVLNAFEPASAQLSVKHLKLKKLLYTLGQPLYADADIAVEAELPDLRSGKLDGKVTFDALNGHADRAAVAKAFEWPHFKGADFTAHTVTSLSGDTVTTGLDLTSDLLTLRSKTIRFDVKPQTLSADYSAGIPDLNRLYFLTERPMRGAATVTGKLQFDKTLSLDAESKMLGGKITSTLRDQTLKADLDGLSTLQAMHMLQYPEVFDSTMNGIFAYDIGTKIGELKAKLTEGRFTRNNVFDLMRQYTTLNLYEEKFTGDTLARINDKKIDADLTLHSNRSSLESQHAKIDTASQTIDAKVHLNANNNPIDFRLKGALDHPGVSVDAGKLIEREAGKQIKKLLDNFLK